MLRGHDTGWGGVLVRLGAFAVLLILTTPRLSGQSVELVSRVHPSQFSDTGTGAVVVDASHPEEIVNPPLLSADGRYAVFLSSATNLVAGQRDMNQGDQRAGQDVFLKDLVTGTTTLVSQSLSSPVTTGNRRSKEAVISADGRYVAFTSYATDLVPRQTSSGFDPGLFLYDRVQGTTSLVAASEVLTDPVLSADGRYVAFSSGARLVPGQQGPGRLNVFLYDRVERTFRLASHTSGSTTTGEAADSYSPRMSSDGRYVIFTSHDSSSPGVFLQRISLYDRTTEAVIHVGPGLWAAISANGKSIAVSDNSQTYLYDRETLETVRLSPRLSPEDLALSADGRFVAFVSHDTDLVPGQQVRGSFMLFLYDRMTRTYTLASRQHGSPTVPGYGVSSHAISADGRFVVFESSDPDIVTGQVDDSNDPDVFLFDRLSGATTLLSGSSASPVLAGNGISYAPTISADGSRIAFLSLASDLMAGFRDFNNGYDAFAYDIASGNRTVITARAPETPSLSPGGRSWAQALSADGRFVAFETESPHVIAGQTDSNGANDVFLYDRTTRNTLLVSRSLGSATNTGRGRSTAPVLSADGRYVVFISNATDLAPGADESRPLNYVFLFDRVSGTSTLVGPTVVPDPPEVSFSLPPAHVSSDGRWVAFESQAGNLVPGQQDQERTFDIFLWDRTTRSTVLVSRSAAGATKAGNGESLLPRVSEDGRYIAFLSVADDLVPGQNGNSRDLNLFLHDRVTSKTVLVNHTRDSAVTAAPLSDYALDMSGDGRFVVFSSPRGDLDPKVTTSEPGAYVYDRTLGTNQWIGFSSEPPRISLDGKYIVFIRAEQIPGVPGFYGQLYLYDRVGKSSVLITRSRVHDGQPSIGSARNPVLSTDGRYVAFLSYASDLVPGQTSSPWRTGSDVFLFDRITGATTLISHSGTSPATAVGQSRLPLISASGRQVAFTTSVNLAEGDFNNREDAYVFSLDPPPPPGPTPLPACTLLDTRRRANRPVLRSNVQRTVTVRGACGVPATAKQVVVKVTVFNPSGKGNLRFYPGAVTQALSGILRFERGVSRAESFTLPLSTNGTLTILPFVAGKGTVHAAVEVNGYSQ
jgi:Tol biopolymer transport system component